MPPLPRPARVAMADELHEATLPSATAASEAVLSMFREARLGKALDAEAACRWWRTSARSVLRNPGALVSLARLKTQDEYSYMHSVAVCALMVALGREVGLDEDELPCRRLAGLMHDLGKAVMPLDVLNKPGKLTEDEFAVMRSTPSAARPAAGRPRRQPRCWTCACTTTSAWTAPATRTSCGRRHLDRMARMGAICDVYDAITSNRPYKKGWDPAESIARMASWKGHFDTPVPAFVKSLGIYPVGSLVRLESGRLAVVTEQNPAR
jgi:HD-GYP domain-containing protein (c-di-GMP phosphodiesterase class II)